MVAGRAIVWRRSWGGPEVSWPCAITKWRKNFARKSMPGHGLDAGQLVSIESSASRILAQLSALSGALWLNDPPNSRLAYP